MRLSLFQAAEVRLGRQRSPQYEVGDHLVPYLRSANVLDGELDLTDVKSMNFTPQEQVVFGLQPGDVLVTEGSGSLETVGTSAVWEADTSETVCFQNTLLRLRPRTGVTDGRFLAWWARHARLSGQIAAVCSGANIQHLGSDGLKRLNLHVPDLEDQRRIADFLDDRITGIDRIIAARTAQEALIAEAQAAEIDALIRGSESAIRPLQSVTDPRRPIQYGIVLPGPDFPDGVPIIKGGDIGSGRLARLELNRTDPAIERAYVRSRVQPGDLVIAIRGSVGEIDDVPTALSTANLTQDSARIAPHLCDPQWLRVVLTSPTVQAAMARMITGATVKGINIEDLRRVPIPVPGELGQRAIARAGLDVRLSGDAHRAALESSIALLTEYKQSLITSAVTGEFDVTAIGSEIPG